MKRSSVTPRGPQYWVASLLFVLLTACYLLGLLDAGDHYLQDTFYSAKRTPDPRIFVIGIDEDSLEQYGPWNSWSRENTAALLRYLNEDPTSKPAVIGVDVMFFGNTTQQADDALVEAVREGGNVVLPAQAIFSKELVRENGRTGWDYGNINKIEQPFEALRQEVSTGVANVISDADGIVRNGIYTVTKDETTVYSFAAAIYQAYAQQAGLESPLNRPPAGGAGSWYIPFAGKPGDFFGTAGKGTSWVRVMNGEIPRELFADSIVLVGPYSAGMMDSYATSVERHTPMHGVEVHANQVQALLEGRFVRYASGYMEVVIGALLTCVLFVAFTRLSARKAALLAGGACVAYTGAAVLAFQAGILLTLVYPLLLMIVSYLSSLITSYILVLQERAALYLQMRRLFINCIRTIANAIDAKDPCTSGHCRRVAKYALMIGRDMDFNELDLADLEYTAILHDVGKISVADRILKKEGPLTDEEYAEMKTHPMRGAQILDDIREFKDHITDGTRYHHERYDGKGYCEGLAGEEIPLFARIIAVADSYDAMTQNRPYRTRMPRERAIAELQRGAGTQFDPAIAARFVRLLEQESEEEFEQSPEEENLPRL